MDLDRKYIFEQKGWVLHGDLSEKIGTQEKILCPKRKKSTTAETVPKRKESTENPNFRGLTFYPLNKWNKKVLFNIFSKRFLEEVIGKKVLSHQVK